MMILALKYNWVTPHVGIKTAFLSGDIDRHTIVRYPMNIPQELRSTQKYLLLKSLYRLHQAPLQWFLNCKVY